MREAFNRTRLEEILNKLDKKDKEYIQTIIRKLTRLSERDYLVCEIYNRRKFEQDLESTISEADKKNKNASIIMLDIDGFKEYNDTHGHRQGDKLLKSLVKHLRREERKLYRYGGEEFALLLPNRDLKIGTKIALRLCKGVEKHFQDSSKITISVGVASYKPQKGNPKYKADKLVKKADKALYHAKQNGKNRVKAYTNRLRPV